MRMFGLVGWAVSAPILLAVGLGAIYWARIEKIYFASDRIAAAKSGFNDDFIYSEISLKLDERKIKSKQLLESEGVKLFENWLKLPNKTTY